MNWDYPILYLVFLLIIIYLTRSSQENYRSCCWMGCKKEPNDKLKIVGHNVPISKGNDAYINPFISPYSAISVTNEMPV